MTERLALFEMGLQRCNDLLQKYPNYPPLQSVQKQISYLIGIERGINSDRSRLKEITIGILTVREIEGLDNDDVFEIFHQISAVARAMNTESKT